MNNLDKLKELTEKLPPIPKLTDLVVSKEITDNIEYFTEKGRILGKSLLDKPSCSVQELVLEKGSLFPPHTHDDEIEFGIIYEGELEVTIDGKAFTVGKGEIIKFNKQEVHSGLAIVDTWMIAVAIPRIDGYPKN